MYPERGAKWGDVADSTPLADIREAAAEMKHAEFVHAVVSGPPIPSPRLRATLTPTAPFPVILQRMRYARKMRDLMSCFRARVYQGSEKIRDWSKVATAELERAKAEAGYLKDTPMLPPDYPIEIMILVVAQLPKSAERKTLAKQPGRIWLISRGGGDWDNYGKPICDVAQGILWDEDCQIARATVETIRAAQGEESRLEILARPLNESPTWTMFERELRAQTRLG